MKKLAQKELADLLKNDVSDIIDFKSARTLFFGNSLNKFDLFDEYKNIYNEQSIKNHLECYNQIRLLIFRKCLKEVQYAQIDAVKYMDEWREGQFKIFVDNVIVKLFRTPYVSSVYDGFDSIIKSYLTYIGRKDISLPQFKSYKKNDKDGKYKRALYVLLLYIKEACILSAHMEKELNTDQLKLIDMYRTYFLYQSPIVKFINETSKPQFSIDMEYARKDSPEFYSIIFQLYLMSDNKEVNTHSLENAILDQGNPKEAYDDFITFLWKWGQKEKRTSPIPFPKLKRFCCEVLQLVSDNNSYARKNSQDFKNTNAGWRTLRRANENILSKRRPPK